MSERNAKPSLWSRIKSAASHLVAPSAAPTGKRGGFAAALWNRLTSDWVLAASRSADNDLRYDLRTMRNRARDLVRNSPFGVRIAQLYAENIIGPDGIRLQAKNKTKEGKLFDVANDAIEDGWAMWARPGNCDVTGKHSLTELLSLAVGNWPTDGEILFRILRGPQFAPFGIKLQLLDPDYIDDLLFQEELGEKPLIRQGIEFDSWGKPVAYHLWKRHPFDATAMGGYTGEQLRIRIPAEDIIHIFVAVRPGQSRGYPHTAPVMTTIKMLDGYVEAELVAARTASASMGAIIDADPQNPATQSAEAGATAIPAEAEPGAMFDLRGTGGKLDLWDPQHPTQAFGDFTRMLAHYIAAGIGISYATLTGDQSQANYGSQRVGMLTERDHWERLQEFVITHLLDRVYLEWIKMALLNQQLVGITDYDVARWITVRWQTRGFDWIDPLKDLQADLIGVAAGTNTLTAVTAKRTGRDLEEVLEERRAELDLLVELGVTSTLATTLKGQQDAGGAPASDASGGNDQTANKSKTVESGNRELVELVRGMMDRVDSALAQLQAANASLSGVVERQASALSVAAQKPAPAPQVTIADGAVRVHVENKTDAPAKPIAMRRDGNNRTVLEYAEAKK